MIVKNTIIILLLVAAGISSLSGDEIMDLIKQAPKEHPRIFINRKQLAELKTKFDKDPLLKKGFEHVRSLSDQMMDIKPVKRIQTGRRLLHVSRTVLRRVSYLSFAYLFTEEKKYAERAEKEMLAAAGFSDWNPSHFLDVAEMTAALGIGYDWCFDGLTEKGKDRIRNAILELGLKQGLKVDSHWLTGHNNWNQVCHGGLTIGALAVLEEYPAPAQQTIQRAKDNIHHSMQNYAPDGAYPEGPGYWNYGTSYNVMLIAALESALGTDFGISEKKGFLESSDYYLHAGGSSGIYFNYSDCGAGGKGVAPAMYWFASRRNDHSLLWQEKQNLERFFTVDHKPEGERDRIFPLTLIWAPFLDDIKTPEKLSWKGEGITPVGFHRSSWDREGMFAAIKAGTPTASHAHLDIGTFVIDAEGERWVHDLGSQNYHGLESKGIQLWGRSQDSERWTIFRLNNFGHSTLVVDDKLQNAESENPITGFSDKKEFSFTTIDMSDAYKDQLTKAHRGLALAEEKSVIVQDEITAPNKDITVRWGFITKADAELEGDSIAVLRQNGKTMTVKVIEGADVKLEIYNTEKPKKPYDEANPGTCMVGFTVKLKADSENTFAVQFVPGSARETEYDLKPLNEWGWGSNQPL